MRLYLLRHAPALSRDEWDGPDSLRPLSEEGATIAHDVAARIARMELGLEAIVTSPHERALRTAVAVSEAIGTGVELAQDERLKPHAFTRDSLLELLSPFSAQQSVMLVGHDPSMTSTMSELLSGGRYSLKKGGLVRIDLDLRDPDGALMKWLVPPRLLTSDR